MTFGCASTARRACSTGRIATPVTCGLQCRGSQRESSAGGTRSCRRTSSLPDGPRADILKDCAKRLPTSTSKWRKNVWHARLATPCLRYRFRALRTASTPWRSSRRASHHRRRARGCQSQRHRRLELRRSPRARGAQQRLTHYRRSTRLPAGGNMRRCLQWMTIIAVTFCGGPALAAAQDELLHREALKSDQRMYDNFQAFAKALRAALGSEPKLAALEVSENTGSAL